jgi:DUF917 family protein
MVDKAGRLGPVDLTVKRRHLSGADQVRKLRRQELEDIVVGATLLGAGGGGSPIEGMKLVERIFEFGSGVDLALVDEIHDDQWGATIAGVGSPTASLTRVRTYSPTYALELLEETCGFKSSFVIPSEVGAGNSINPMLAAVQQKIPIVDGDPVGRAAPEIQMSTFCLAGIPASPLALATEEGISAVIRAEDAHDIERVTRAITSELGGVSAVACHVVEGGLLKKHILPGTTSLSEQIGATIREAKDGSKNVASVLVDRFNGYLLGKGRVSSMNGKIRGGFDIGAVEVEGELPLRVVFQNENMIAFRDEKLMAIVPDLICGIDKGGNPLTNVDTRQGMEITYLGFPAPSAFRGQEVFALFKNILRTLGYEEGFVPIEELAESLFEC